MHVWRDFKLPMSASATVTRKSFIFEVKFTAKIDVSKGYFILPLLMLTSKVYSFSIRSLISI